MQRVRQFEIVAFLPTDVSMFCVYAQNYEAAEAIANVEYPNAIDFEIVEV
jgi:hypothetical protein